ncbi:MAG: hypothetical protein ACPG7F_16790 [Aggregatilineales bacterium]
MTRQFPEETLHDPNDRVAVADESPRKEHDLPPLYNDTLMNILGITHHDIEGNQRQQVTVNQRSKFQGDLKEDSDASWLLMNIGLGVLLLLSLIFLVEGLPMNQLVFGGGVYMGAFFFTAYRRQTGIRNDMQAADIKTVRGFPQLLDTGRLDRDDGRYWMMMGRERFKITAEQYRRLNQYDIPELNAYYAARTNTLLAAEVVPFYDEKAKKAKNDRLLADDSEADVIEMDVIDDPMTEVKANQHRSQL